MHNIKHLNTQYGNLGTLQYPRKFNRGHMVVGSLFYVLWVLGTYYVLNLIWDAKQGFHPSHTQSAKYNVMYLHHIHVPGVMGI